MPPMATGPIFRFAPSVGLVINEFRTCSVIGVFAAVPCEMKRATTGNLPSGMRYAGFIQKPLSGLVTAEIEVTCFIQYTPVQPGTMTRAGKPLRCGSG